MNNSRRKRIAKCIQVIVSICENLENVYNDIQDLQCEEQDCFENLPESLRNSNLGEKIQSASDALQDAADAVSEAISNLESAQENMEEATYVD